MSLPDQGGSSPRATVQTRPYPNGRWPSHLLASRSMPPDSPFLLKASGPPSEEQPASQSTDDDALILWFLSLTPTQRLEVAQGFVDSVQALRKGRPLSDQETP